jgi:hypothetical protein
MVSTIAVELIPALYINGKACSALGMSAQHLRGR